jgi:hypothetical protein
MHRAPAAGVLTSAAQEEKGFRNNSDMLYEYSLKLFLFFGGDTQARDRSVRHGFGKILTHGRYLIGALFTGMSRMKSGLSLAGLQRSIHGHQ